MSEINRAEIIDVCRRLHDKGWLAACDGNVSVRLDSERVLITPTARNKAFLQENELAIVTLDDQILAGNPSSERLMHLQIYREREDAGAVVHAHPPTAIAWSIAKPFLKELPHSCLSEVILATGRIPIVPYARPGTQDMGSKLVPFLNEGRKCLILSNHGALSWGTDLEEAYNGTERLEHAAQTLMYAKQIAGLNELPFEEVRELQRMRKKIGNQTL